MGSGKKALAWLICIIEALIFGFMVLCTTLTVYSFIQYKTTPKTDNRHKITTLEKRVVIRKDYI